MDSVRIDPASTYDGDARPNETRFEMLSRHTKEMKDLQWKETALKKAAAKGSKAEQKAKKKCAEEEVAKLDLEMKARQADELASLGFQGEEWEETASIHTLVKAMAGVTTAATHLRARPSKSQKFRDKRAQEAAERELRIQDEQNNLVNRREIEDRHLLEKLNPIGLGLKEIKPDGHCLYRAVEDQLTLYPDSCPAYSYQQLRELAARYMLNHAEDFLPFIGGDLEKEIEGKDPRSRFETYCREMESTASWGGQLELGALAQVLKKHIIVYAASGPAIEMGKEYVNEEARVLGAGSIRVSFHKYAFGLGEHYNSVVPLLSL